MAFRAITKSIQGKFGRKEERILTREDLVRQHFNKHHEMICNSVQLAVGVAEIQHDEHISFDEALSKALGIDMALVKERRGEYCQHRRRGTAS